MNKKILVVALGVALLGGGLFGATRVSAQSVTNADPMNALVTKLATKFGLNQSEVQAVFTEHHDEMRKTMEARLSERLSLAVSSGAITEAQKQLIVAKRNELQAKHEAERESMQGKTDAERKAIMESHRAEVETWATENNIDTKYLFGGFGHHRGNGMGKWYRSRLLQNHS